ncbi:NAD(P)/FAD-dependent oxidoreductase [Streptomyces sp. NPDC048111]|uniref:NAD(P)/FAD-dependent oxidoreductase n=1 Tax=Streptomyces sp. NPDC048111 TaxID=3365500 RepID=UPI00371C4957
MNPSDEASSHRPDEAPSASSPGPGAASTASSRGVGAASSPTARAVVIGGGLAGMLAAAALRGHCDEITVVEQDVLPAGAEPRRGLPQARHGHMLWCGGAEAMERLVPGVLESWLAFGARRIPLTSGMVGLSPQGWYRRWRDTHYLISCGRDLLDWVVRERVTADPSVRVLQRTKVLRLTGTAGRVTGVRVRGEDGAERVIEADLVVDAAGRGSHAQRWLTDLGVPAAKEEVVDAGTVYASRRYRSPAGEHPFPVVSLQTDVGAPTGRRTAVLLPIEDGQWLITLSGMRGGRPTADTEAFLPFARTAGHEVVAELLAEAAPLSDVSTYANTANRRRYFERVARWPEGFTAIGDAVAVSNPVYGHGMSVAALSALALRGVLDERGLTSPGLARRIQRAVARPVAMAWTLSAGQDAFYPGAASRAPGPAERLLSRYVNRLMLTSTGNYTVATALTEVMTLSGPAAGLVHPRVLFAALAGPGRPRLTGPPLTDRELALVQSPQKTP